MRCTQHAPTRPPTAERVARSVATEGGAGGAEVTTLKRDLASLQANQSGTQDTLEAVHDTLERLVERLAMVETDIRSDAPAAAPQPSGRVSVLPQAASAAAKPMVQVPRRDRPPIDPDLPADTPLEPGVVARSRTPAERIAASEAALSPMKREETGELSGKANFIAAARRAAQAAASEGTPVENARVEEGSGDEAQPGLISRFLANRRRALMIGVGILLVLYGATQVMHMMSGSDERPAEPPRPSSSQIAPPPAPEQPVVAVPVPPPAAPAASEPAPAPQRQSAIAPPVLFVAPIATPQMIASTPVQSMPAAPTPAAQPQQLQPPIDITGSVPTQIAAPRPTGAIAPPLSLQAPALTADKLPAGDRRPGAARGRSRRQRGCRIRDRPALCGRPRRTGEPGTGCCTGSSAPPNAASRPPSIRLGSFYEKGLGVKKDLNKARTLYLAAADKGNAKAMHNLAVLYAEGIDGKPDYRNAAQWFRKAAERGVADSQYNLGILYARGIGVEQNLAEVLQVVRARRQRRATRTPARSATRSPRRLDQQSLVAAQARGADLRGRSAARRGDRTSRPRPAAGTARPPLPPSRCRDRSARAT